MIPVSYMKDRMLVLFCWYAESPKYKIHIKGQLHMKKTTDSMRAG